jgi:hypothetical protein
LVVNPSDKLTLVARVRSAAPETAVGPTYSLLWDDAQHEIVSLGR